MNIILQEENCPAMLARLNALGTLSAIHPELVWDEETQTRLDLARQTPDPTWELAGKLDGYPLSLALSYVLWSIMLPGPSAAQLAGRLRLPGWLTKNILAAGKLRDQLPQLEHAPASQLVAVLDDVPHLAIYARYLISVSKTLRQALQRYMTEWRFVQPHTNGHDLRARGIPSGPQYRHLLDTLRNAWLDGLIHDREQELALLEKLLND